MISEIVLRNFKVARELTLPIAPLTLLAGLNGSGKSTVLQSVAMLYQSYSIRGNSDLQLAGPIISLGQGKDVLCSSAQDDRVSVSIVEDGSRLDWSFTAKVSGNQFPFDSKPPGRPAFSAPDRFQYLQADRIIPSTLYPRFDQYTRAAGFLGSHGQYTVDYLSLNGRQPVREARRCSFYEGSGDEDLWSQVAATANLMDQVAGWLQRISPGVHLDAEHIVGTDEVQLKFRYLGAKMGGSDYIRPTNVGFGLTYCLPIVVACLAAEPGSLLLIENPEAHLHPHGQSMFGTFLGMCANDGVQVIVETHSDHILNGARLAVKSKKIPSENIRLAYFTRDVSSGESYVELPMILPDGQLSNRPPGFFDQWSHDLDSLLQ